MELLSITAPFGTIEQGICDTLYVSHKGNIWPYVGRQTYDEIRALNLAAIVALTALIWLLT